MKYLKLLPAAAFLALAITASAGASDDNHFWLGADISGTTDDESHGYFSRNAAGDTVENTLLMKQLGLDAVRLRVWVNPKDGFSSKEDVLEMARRAKQHDMAIMIDFHYSDWWADPGHQNQPAAWARMEYPEMKRALADHTRETLQLLRDNDIDVRWVQVGNETSNGFLWPMGHTDNMVLYAGFTAAGYDALKEVYPDATVIVHLDNGFDFDLYERVFGGLKQYGGKWDMIGMSLYPYWTMQSNPSYTEELTIKNCTENMRRVSRHYGCPVMLVETGYEAARPEEGKAYMTRLIDAMKHETDGACRGVFYWAPETCRGGYALGAFKDGQPTAIMEAFTEASTQP